MGDAVEALARILMLLHLVLLLAPARFYSSCIRAGLHEVSAYQ